MTRVSSAAGLVTSEGVQTSGADPACVYQIGSVSKVFTALLLALEVVEGRLTLETRLGELMPALDDRPLSEVTLSALVTHTSGLPRLPPGMWRRTFNRHRHNPYADYDEQMLIAAIRDLTPKPSSRARYSNLGFGLLGGPSTRWRGRRRPARARCRGPGELRSQRRPDRLPHAAECLR